MTDRVVTCPACGMAGGQHTLFCGAPPHRARLTDPGSAHAAAGKLNGAPLRDGARRALVLCDVVDCPGTTERDGYKRSGVEDRSTWTPTYALLRKGGDAYNRPEGHPERYAPPDPETGCRNLRWFPTQQGIDKVRRLRNDQP